MNRRGFLRGLLLGGAAIAFRPDLLHEPGRVLIPGWTPDPIHPLTYLYRATLDQGKNLIGGSDFIVFSPVKHAVGDLIPVREGNARVIKVSEEVKPHASLDRWLGVRFRLPMAPDGPGPVSG